MSSNSPFKSVNPNNPLTYKHLSDIVAALSALDVAQAQIDLATAAGLDMTTQQASLTAQRNQLLKIKQVYFPGQ